MVNRLVLWCGAVPGKSFEVNEGGIPGMTGCDRNGRPGPGLSGTGRGVGRGLWGKGARKELGEGRGNPGWSRAAPCHQITTFRQ